MEYKLQRIYDSYPVIWKKKDTKPKLCFMGCQHMSLEQLTDWTKKVDTGLKMAGKALCLPRTIGSTTGGLVLYCACSMQRQPACMLFSEPIDSLAAAGAILADVWLKEANMPVVDSLGEDFLQYVKDTMSITVKEDGTVEVAD
ncbi:MAG: DUF126 domain-containing protein [bacterium]|nr:DUF126 domain-containing protein [bacterium]